MGAYPNTFAHAYPATLAYMPDVTPPGSTIPPAVRYTVKTDPYQSSGHGQAWPVGFTAHVALTFIDAGDRATLPPDGVAVTVAGRSNLSLDGGAEGNPAIVSAGSDGTLGFTARASVAGEFTFGLTNSAGLTDPDPADVTGEWVAVAGGGLTLEKLAAAVAAGLTDYGVATGTQVQAVESAATGAVQSAADAAAAAVAGQISAGLTDAQAAQLAAVLAGVSQLGGGQVTYAGPVAKDGTVQLVQGDDVVLTWTVVGYTGPSLVGATVTFGLLDRCAYDTDPAAPPLRLVAGTATAATVDGVTSVTYSVPLTAAQTLALPPSPTRDPLGLVGQVVVTTAGNLRRTAVLAAVTVVRRVV